MKIGIDMLAPTLQPRFGRYYVCFDGSKKAFRKACRPLSRFNGCHWKSKYGGILLIAVGKVNNRY